MTVYAAKIYSEEENIEHIASKIGSEPDLCLEARKRILSIPGPKERGTETYSVWMRDVKLEIEYDRLSKPYEVKVSYAPNGFYKHYIETNLLSTFNWELRKKYKKERQARQREEAA